MKDENIKDRINPIKVLVSEKERIELLERSQKAGLPISTYLRNVALGHRTKSRLDLEMALELLKMNGELWRLGDLLKSSLSQDEMKGSIDAKEVLKQIEKTMDEIRRKASLV